MEGTVAVLAILAGIGIAWAFARKSPEAPPLVTGEPLPVPPFENNRIERIAHAIATAEGWYVSGSRPRRNNNPGNLTLDIAGGGKAVGKDGLYMVYGSPEDGWADLRGQIGMMLDGSSRHYKPSMSIIEVARKYTATEQESWAGNVARVLQCSIHTPIGEV